MGGCGGVGGGSWGVPGACGHRVVLVGSLFVVCVCPFACACVLCVRACEVGCLLCVACLPVAMWCGAGPHYLCVCIVHGSTCMQLLVIVITCVVLVVGRQLLVGHCFYFVVIVVRCPV